MSENTLLKEAVEAASDLGADIQEMVQDKLQGRGYTHAIATIGDEQFSLRAKEYRYQGNSSFGLEQVEEADDEGYKLLSYISQTDSLTVFDPEYVLENGSTYTESSKKSQSRVWIEVDASAGVPAPAHVAGRAEPETLAGENATLGSF